MSDLVVVGLSHRTAPLEVREQLSVATENLPSELHSLVGGPVGEGLLLSTCNRVEFYGAASDAPAAIERARQHLRSRGISPETVDGMLYARLGSDAVRHVFRVAASLDSMVVGEPQILGQVKASYQAAEAHGSVGTLLSRCFERAFAVAKRVRNETGIAHGAVSVSSIAIELASKIFGNLKGRHTLLVGAGKMSEAAAKSLAGRGAHLFVVNRSPERAQKLALACGGEARGYERLAVELAAADVVITSTASPRFVITHDLMKEVVKVRRRRPLFLIDIAVPRDVDPRCGDLENVFLYDVDDLQKVAGENINLRQREASAAEQIVETETEAFERWRRSLILTPTIVALRTQFREIARAELERTMPRLSELSSKDRKTLEKMTDAIVNKMLHEPLVQLKAQAELADGPLLIDAAQRLFNLGAERPAVAEVERPSGEHSRTPATEGLEPIAAGAGRSKSS